MANLIDKFMGAVRGLATDVKTKINDDQGVFQRGKFTPIKAIQQNAFNNVSKTNQGLQKWSKLADTIVNKPFERIGTDISKAKLKLPSTMSKFDQAKNLFPTAFSSVSKNIYKDIPIANLGARYAGNLAKSGADTLVSTYKVGKSLGQGDFKGAGMNLLDVAGSGLNTVFRANPYTAIPWLIYEAEKGGSAKRIRGGTYEEQVKSALDSLVGDEYSGLGTALTTDPKIEQGLNIAENVAFLGYGIYQGWKAFKNWNDLRLKTRILKDAEYNKDLQTLTKYGFNESDFYDKSVMRSKLVKTSNELSIGKAENQPQFSEFIQAYNRIMNNHYSGVPKIKTTAEAPAQKTPTNKSGYMNLGEDVFQMKPEEYLAKAKNKLIQIFQKEPPASRKDIVGSKEARANFIALKKEFMKDPDTFINKYAPQPRLPAPVTPQQITPPVATPVATPQQPIITQPQAPAAVIPQSPVEGGVSKLEKQLHPNDVATLRTDKEIEGWSDKQYQEVLKDKIQELKDFKNGAWKQGANQEELRQSINELRRTAKEIGKPELATLVEREANKISNPEQAKEYVMNGLRNIRDKRFEMITPSVVEGGVLPYSDFESAFGPGEFVKNEYVRSKKLFRKDVFEVNLSDIYKSPNRPEFTSETSNLIKQGKILPPVKLLFNPDKDGTIFTVLDGRTRIQGAEKLNLQKVGAVITDTDPKTGEIYPGLDEWIKNNQSTPNVTGEEVGEIQPPMQNFTPPSSNIVDEIAYQNTVKNGGVTINLKGVQPTEGYAYAPSKNTEVKIDETKFSVKDIENFKAKNAELLKDPNNHLGFWKENGIIYMDVSRVGPPTPETIAAAKAADQLAVFDLKEFKTIYTKDYETVNSPNIGGEQNLGTVVPGDTGGPQEVQQGGSGIPSITTDTSPATVQEKVTPVSDGSLFPAQKERGLITSVKENPSVEPGIRKQVSGNYDMTTDDGRIAYGQELYSKDPVGTLNKAMSEQPPSPEASGISYAVFHNLQKKAYEAKKTGNQSEYVTYRDQASEVMKQWAKRLTPGAQEIQFAHLMSYSDPMDMVNFIKDIYDQSNEFQNMNLSRMISKVKTKITGKGEDKWKLGVTPEMEQEIIKTMENINIMPSGPEKDAATQRLMIKMTEKIPYPLRMLIDAYRYQNMLSGLRTHLKNTYGNTFQAYVLYPTHMLDMAAWDMITGNPNPKYKFSDIPAHYRSMFGSLKLAKDNFMSKIRNTNMQLGKSEDFNQTTFNQMMLGKTPQALTLTGRFLEAQDGFFTTIIGNSYYSYLKSKGVEEVKAREGAQRMAEYLLFRDKLHPEGQSWLLKQMDNLTKWINAGRSKFAPLNWFVPFINVMMRITKQNLEYLPLTSWATTIGAADKATQFSKLRIGLLISVLGAIAAMTGNSTWGVPTDAKEKAAFYNANMKPYAFNVLGTWVPMWFLGPWAMAFGMVPAFKQYFEDSKTSKTDSFLAKTTNSLLAILNFVAQSTPLAGLGGFIRTMQGDIDFSVINNIAFAASQLVPMRGFVSDVAKVVDPVFRKAKGFTQTIQKDIPFLSRGLPAYTNTTTGEESRRNITDYIFPYSLGFNIPPLEKEYRNLVKTNQLRSEANVYKKIADESNPNPVSAPSSASTSEKNLKANLTNINSLLESYEKITDEKLREKIQKSVEGYGVNFSDAYENYLTKDVAVHQKGLTKESQATLKRSKEFAYVRKLRDLYDGTGVGGDFLTQELAKKNITEADLNYDDQTALPDDVQLEEIKNSISSLSGEALIETLISYRRISEGTRKALLTDTLITKLNKEGVIGDDLAAMLKSVGWDTKTGQFKTIPGTGKKIDFTETKVPAFKSISSKKITVPKFKFPDIKSGGSSSAYAKIKAKMPKVSIRKYTPSKSRISVKIPRQVTRIKNLGRA